MTKKYIFIILLGIIINIIHLVNNGFDLIIYYTDAFFISGASILLIGALSVMSYLGAFDIFGYSSYYVANSIKPDKQKRYADYNDYSEKRHLEKSKNKLYYVPYLVVGGALILLSIITLLF